MYIHEAVEKSSERKWKNHQIIRTETGIRHIFRDYSDEFL